MRKNSVSEDTEQLLSQSSIDDVRHSVSQSNKSYQSLIFSILFLIFGLAIFFCVVVLLIVLIFFVKNPTKELFQYALIGDWGREGNYYQSSVAKIMSNYCYINDASKSGCKEVISLGDNLYESGVETDDDPLFQKSFVNIYGPYRSLNIPWRIIMGNHDYKKNPFAQISYAKKQDTLWVTEGNGLYYSYKPDIPFINMTFIYIDTVPMLDQYWNPNSGINQSALVNPEAQLNWFEEELKTATQNNMTILVFGHHPVYCVSDKNEKELQDMQRSIENLLVRYRIPFYICGHEHNLQHIVMNYDKDNKPILDKNSNVEVAHTINYIISGGGSETRTIPNENKYLKYMSFGYQEGGFVGLRVDSDLLNFEYITHKGEIQHNIIYTLNNSSQD